MKRLVEFFFLSFKFLLSIFKSYFCQNQKMNIIFFIHNYNLSYLKAVSKMHCHVGYLNFQFLNLLSPNSSFLFVSLILVCLFIGKVNFVESKEKGCVINFFKILKLILFTSFLQHPLNSQYHFSYSLL